MAKEFRVRDPVHSFVRLTAEEVKVVNTPVFQRLRGIKQLALANLVYPGALHTRFDHSLGVCHVAGMMGEELGLGNEDKSLVRLAALLHDLGHGPFSHVSEDALERYSNRERLGPGQKKEKIHELITADLIKHRSDLSFLGDKRDMVVQLLGQGYGEPVLRNIVSGPLDADKQDYLLRDSRFCGVPYGVFDIEQFHRSLVLGEGEDEKELWINRDGVHAVEQYVLAKYYMTTMVYRHQVRLITDQMITRAIVLGIEHDKSEELQKLYAYDGSDAFLENYVEWSDARFVNVFGGDDAPGALCKEMLDRLRHRRLLKQVFTQKIGEFAEPDVKDLLPNLSKPKYDKLRQTLEQDVTEVVRSETETDIDARFVIVFAFDVKSVRTTSRDDEGSIMVQTAPDPRPFEVESTLFKSINERYSDGDVEVYAPIVWGTPAARKKLRDKLRDPIRDLIVKTCKSAVGEGVDHECV